MAVFKLQGDGGWKIPEQNNVPSILTPARPDISISEDGFSAVGSETGGRGGPDCKEGQETDEECFEEGGGGTPSRGAPSSSGGR